MSRARRGALVLWTGLRLPLLALLLFTQRDAVVALAERELGLAWPTEVAILLIGSGRERAVLLALLAATLVLGGLALARAVRSRPAARGLHAVLAFGVLLAGFRWTSGAWLALDTAAAAALALLLAANAWEPATAAHDGRPRPSRSADRFFALAVGSELLLPGPWLTWLAAGLGARLAPAGRLVPGAAAVSLLAVVYLSAHAWARPAPVPPPGLEELRALLPGDPAVERIARGDYNRVVLAADGRTLYATGHGVPRLRAFDVEAPEAPPRVAAEPTGRAEDFAYDRDAGELYVYKHRTRSVLVLDAATLAPRRTLALPGLAPGDASLVWDGESGRLYVLSEADLRTGYALAVVDGRGGEVLARLAVAAGSGGLLDPRRPRLYLTFFRGRSEVAVFDTERGAIARSLPADARSDGMAFDARGDALLVGSPLRGRILRYRGDTLAPAGELPAPFGVRGLAVDPERRLVLAASLVTHALDAIDLESGRRLARYRLGPWLRKLWLDPGRGLAWVSSRYGIYQVRYTARLPARDDS